MKRLDPSLNGGSTAYADGNPTTGAGGTVPQADPLNHIQEELCYLVEQAGITLNTPSGTKTQVRAAVLAMIASYLAANSPDTYLGNAVLTSANFNVTDAALSVFPETFAVKFISANPASATLSLNGGAGAALLDNAGVALAAGDIAAGQIRLVANTGTELRVFPATQGDFLKRDGSLAMTGLLRLFGNAVHVLDATPLQQVTSLIASAMAGLSPAAIKGAYKNLQASSSGLSANVLVSVDEIVVENTSNEYATLRTVSLTIAGTTTGANALDTGTIVGSTWYSVWVIYNGTTTAGLLSLSATAPTMPSGYTHKARVGWIRTDSSGNKYPLGFKQYGRTVQYIIGTGNLTSSPMIVSGVQGVPTTPTWVAASISTFVPTTAAAISVSLFLTNANATYAILAPNNNYGGSNSTTVPPPLSVGFSGTSIGGNFVLTASLILESTNIYYACNSGQGGATCLGWEDNL